MSAPDDNAAQDVVRDDPMIAAEWALGLLEGEELLSARGKHAVDPEFAWRKEWWDNWFAPLADEIAPAEPSPQVWDRIATAIDTPEPTGEVVMLRARVKRWQWVAGLASGAAAAAVAVLAYLTVLPGTAPLQPPAPLAAAAPLVASVPVGTNGLQLDVTYVPASRQMLVAATSLTADGVHDHELWVVPSDGGPLQSLGVVTPGAVRSTVLPHELARYVTSGATLVLTREPLGGKPAGVDAGPVVARGSFSRV